MQNYPDNLRRVERGLLALATLAGAVGSAVLAPWLRDNGMPDSLVGILGGMAPAGAVFFGGRRWYKAWLWPRLPGNWGSYVGGDWYVTGRKTRFGRRSRESDGAATIVQQGPHLKLRATTSFALYVESTQMMLHARDRGTVRYTGKQHNLGPLRSDIRGVADFYLLYPGGDSRQRPIGILFNCREERHDCQPGGDFVEVLYYRAGMKEEAMCQARWNQRKRRSA